MRKHLSLHRQKRLILPLRESFGHVHIYPLAYGDIREQYGGQVDAYLLHFCVKHCGRQSDGHI